MNDTRRPLREEMLPPLEAGDRLDQKTFHARYEAMPPGTRAELIGGEVHMPSPLKKPHSRMHMRINSWLSAYEDATPGVEAYDNATTILDDDNEPQPDSCLLIATSSGQTHDQDEYIAGSPELVIEVASASESIDLHRKKRFSAKVADQAFVGRPKRSRTRRRKWRKLSMPKARHRMARRP